MNIFLLCGWTIIGGVVGFFLSKSYKNRLLIVCELWELVCEIERNTNVYKKPTKEILEGYKFKTQLEKVVISKVDFAELITKEEVLRFFHFISEIETNQSEKAMQQLGIYKDEVSKMVEKAKEDNKKKGETYQKLGLLFGLAVGILVC